MPFFAPIPWEAERFYAQPGMAERNLSLDWFPVGTGPFMLSENDPNRRMVLSRNPNFHGETYPREGEAGDAEKGLLADAGKALPLIDRAVFTLEKEDIPKWNKFLQGYYDASGISSDNFDQAVQFSPEGDADLTPDMKQKAIRLVTAVATSNRYMGFNMRDPLIGHAGGEAARKLRQAISIAVDYEEFISIFLNGRGIAAHGALPPGIFGYRDDFNPVVYAAPGTRRSLDEARRLLAEAGYPSGRSARTGEPLVLYFDTAATGPDAKSRLDWLTKQFRKLDIQLVIRATDYNRFQDKVNKGSHQIYFWGWLADYPDAENFLFLLYGPNSKSLTNGNGENASNYRSKEFDRRFEQMKFEEDGPAKAKLIDEMIRIVQEDAPWTWGYFPTSAAALHKWVHNGKPTQIIRNHLQYLRVDPALRTQKIAEWNRPIWWPVALIALALVAAVVPAFRAYKRRERENAARTLAREAAAGAGQ